MTEARHGYYDYPTIESTDSKYWQCSYCLRTEPQINGELNGHADWCKYRIAREIEEGKRPVSDVKLLA